MKIIGQRSGGIKAIARELGIAIGTVDRALHNRPGISPSTRTRVLQKAADLGYKPNVAARALKLNRSFRIAVHLPKQIASFFNPLRAGIRSAAQAESSIGVEIDFLSYPRMGRGDLELLRAVDSAKNKYDGLILIPGHPEKMEPLIRSMSQAGTRVVCVSSDAPRSARVAAVTADAFVSGSIAAELLSCTLQAPESVATLTGELTTFDHAEKLRGFAGTLALHAPHLALLPAVESHESPREAYRQTEALLQSCPRLAGLYISTANSMPVLKALEEHHVLGRIRVITTDLFRDLVPHIEAGRVLATLHQRPFTQGKTAFETLIRLLLDETHAESVIRLAPHIVLRSNLPLFLDQLRDEVDAD